MKKLCVRTCAGLLLATSITFAQPAAAQAPSGQPVLVTVDNFKRAETDMYLAGFVKQGAFGKFFHHRDLPVENTGVRPNRNTLYSFAVFDLDAGPVTITLPDAGKRFMSLMVINQDHYALETVYTAGAHRYSRETVGTRYLFAAVRTLVDPADPQDVGKFEHHRELASIDNQTIIRMNRDTLYSAVVIDLDAGPATITMPDPGKRFMSLQIVDEDQYSQTIYAPAKRTFTRKQVGTRYMIAGVRTLIDPSDPKDIERVHALQDALKIEQPGGPGKFEPPKWDPVSQKKIRDALIVLGTTLTDTSRAFGTKDQVDPVQRLISAATTWGGNSKKDAIYLNFTPARNDGKTIYKLNVKDVPVDGFWSISLYNGEGYYQKNDLNAYSLNNLTSKKGPDGSVAVQFGGCDGKIPNCLPIMADWNYTVRLYRPRPEILNGKWKFPDALAAN